MNRPIRRTARLLAVPLLSVGLVTAGATAASSAVPVKCGTVITSSTTLTANVGPCARGGLVIGADGVTLDLGGFAVQGRPNRTGDGAGILLQGRTGVTVKNGRVTDFDAGVALVGGSGNRVENLLVKDNIGTTKRGDFGDGIALSGSSGNVIFNNDVIHNGPFDGIGLFGPSSNNLLEDNVVSGNDVSFTADDGIRIEGPGARDNTVRGNTVTASTLDGIAVFADSGTGNFNTGNVIVDNLVTGNGFGLLGARPGDGIRVFVRANNTTVQGNTVQDNAGSGIFVNAQNNTITGNVATGNARQAAAGTRFDLHDSNTACDNNVWSGNVFGTASQACIG